MSFAFHGNWCGPGWSDGSYQESVRGFAPPIDEFDVTCQDHDFAYADARHLAEDAEKLLDRADDLFYSVNVGRGLSRTVAALAVKSNRLTRSSTNKTMGRRFKGSRPEPEPEISIRLKPTRPKGAKVKPGAPSSRGRKTSPNVALTGVSSAIVTKAAPAAYSNTITGHTVRQNGGVTTVCGREFAGGANAYGSSTSQLVDAIVHHPGYYNTTALGNMVKSFREYRWDYIKITYMGTSSTSSAGWTQIVTNQDIEESAYAYATNTDLLQRSMSTQNSILGNLWENLTHVVPIPGKWALTQPWGGADLRDHVAGETYIYQNIGASGSSSAYGLVLVDYCCSFRNLDYTMHGGIANPFSQYQTFSLVDAASSPTVGTQVITTNSTVTGSVNGSVWRFIMLNDQNTYGTGVTAANVWNTYSINTTGTNTTVKNGTTFYGCVIGSSLYLYPTLEAAKVGSTTTFIGYRTQPTTTSTYVAIGIRVSLGNVDLIDQS